MAAHGELPSSTNAPLLTAASSLLLTHKPSIGTVQKRKARRKKFHETRHPVYKGVRGRNAKWVCELRKPNDKKSRVWVGTFSCPDMAAMAYDVAALALKGKSAPLNFPKSSYSSVSRIYKSSSLSDIRCAVLEATEEIACSRVAVESSSSFPSSSSCPENNVAEEGNKRLVFEDEEELFNMPGIIDSMAEGLILTPPGMQKGFNWDDFDQTTIDLSLWSD